MAGARGEAGNLGTVEASNKSLNPFSIPLFVFQNPQIKISRKYRFILLMHNRSFCSIMKLTKRVFQKVLL